MGEPWTTEEWASKVHGPEGLEAEVIKLMRSELQRMQKAPLPLASMSLNGIHNTASTLPPFTEPSLTARDVRRIVREELRAALREERQLELLRADYERLTGQPWPKEEG